MLDLLILRHAKSSWADSQTDDWARTLTDRGEHDAERAGDLLKRLAIVPDVIVASDAVRAQSTAHRVATAAGFTRKVALSSLLYLAAPQTVIEVLRHIDTPTAPRVMIVGHNPGLEDLVSKLTGEETELSTAALVQIEMPIERWTDADLDIGARLVNSWQPGDY